MAFKTVVVFLLISFFGLRLGGATSCFDKTDCSALETCCNDGICRENCYYCSLNSQCGTGEMCCDGDCAYSCVWTAGSIAGAVIGTIIFFAIIISIASCCCCACCPYYRYRTPGTVIVTGGQPPYQQIVTTSTNTTQQGFVQYPPPGNYNQPPPTYSPPGPAPYPSAQVQGRAAMMPPPGPVKY